VKKFLGFEKFKIFENLLRFRELEDLKNLKLF
jgi:hypothetical protein